MKLPERCIICWCKFLLNKNGQRDQYLIKRCPKCEKVPSEPRFTDSQARYDEKNVVRALTLTLHPKYHSIPVQEIRKTYEKMVIHHMEFRRTPISIRLWFEFTDNLVLHAHGYYAGRKNALGAFVADCRRLGFVCVKTPTDLTKWVDYCLKDQDDDSQTPIIIST